MEDLIRKEVRNFISSMPEGMTLPRWRIGNTVLKKEEIAKWIRSQPNAEGYVVLDKIIVEELQDKAQQHTEKEKLKDNTDVDELITQAVSKGKIALQIASVMDEIDKALDNGDKEKFYVLTVELKRLQSMRDKEE